MRVIELQLKGILKARSRVTIKGKGHLPKRNDAYTTGLSIPLLSIFKTDFIKKNKREIGNYLCSES